MLDLNIYQNAEVKEKKVIIRQRTGQSFFRQTVLGLYDAVFRVYYSNAFLKPATFQVGLKISAAD